MPDNIIRRLINENDIGFFYLNSKRMAALGLSGEPRPGDGFAVRRKGRYYIFVDPTADKYEARYIAAHELGHVLLGHLRGPELPAHAELEANVFAAVLTAFSLITDVQSTKGVSV